MAAFRRNKGNPEGNGQHLPLPPVEQAPVGGTCTPRGLPPAREQAKNPSEPLSLAIH